MRHLVVTLVIKINFFLLFTVNGNSGICLPSADCSTVISPTRGTCSSGTSHICCFEEAPDDVNSDAVAMVLTTMTQVSFNPIKPDGVSQRHTLHLIASHFYMNEENEVSFHEFLS